VAIEGIFEYRYQHILGDPVDVKMPSFVMGRDLEMKDAEKL
jgi:hypothetical protein